MQGISYINQTMLLGYIANPPFFKKENGQDLIQYTFGPVHNVVKIFLAEVHSLNCRLEHVGEGNEETQCAEVHAADSRGYCFVLF